MRKKQKTTIPVVRLVFAVALTGVLFGAGFYAYHQRHPVDGVTLKEAVNNAQLWFAEHRHKIHKEMKKTKKVVLEEAPAQPVKFEFYESLANSKVQIAETNTVAAVIPSAVKSVAPIASHDEIEKDFLTKIQPTE